ncbi:MAG TPA: exodeoxyribonuclease VII small subunit [bacterium]|nr:exodeoxyribonuclease VII small subunit [bacterium]
MPKKDKPTFEDDLARLSEIVAALEEGPETLDEMLALYEEGVAITKRLEEVLDQAETRIKKLSRDAEGEPELEDLDEGD